MMKMITFLKIMTIWKMFIDVDEDDADDDEERLMFLIDRQRWKRSEKRFTQHKHSGQFRDHPDGKLGSSTLEGEPSIADDDARV